ncbi:hypothetical protein [Companilactobacillus sp. HBUAS59544]|uniref:hypothetical protein n=1 Tax=Companilactobacillus sp. HBUAS59544 TaxID=3109363 RepID=UPI002FF0D445
MNLKQAPIFRMYKLVIDSNNRQAFLDEGENNFQTSFETEANTLMMLSAHLDTVGTTNFVFEIYKDNTSYQIHANSPQFKQYGQLAQKIVKDKSLQELEPVFLDVSQMKLSQAKVRVTQFSSFDESKFAPQNDLEALMIAKNDDGYLSVEVSDSSRFNDFRNVGRIEQVMDLNLDNFVSHGVRFPTK